MAPEHKLKTAAALSAYWDGSGHRRVRACDGLIDLVGRRLALNLMVQPDAAATFLADPVLKGQGLLSRFLVAAPASLSGKRIYRDPEPSDLAAINSYEKQLHSILTKPWPLAEGKRNELVPRELVLSPQAVEAFKAFSDHLERQCGPDGELNPILDFASKAAEHAVRISGVQTIIADPQACEISAEAMSRGIELADWYVGEQLRLHAAARTNPKLLTAHRLLEWMGRQRSSTVAFRHILQCGPADLRTKAAARPALDTLCEHGQIVPVSEKPLAYRVREGLPS
jgi:hypothetical protein